MNRRINSQEPLALFGGPKVIPRAYPRYNPIGKEEQAAAKKVIQSGVLSRFLGAWNEDFYGGPKVRQFEKAAADFFRVKHAVTVNSWTSGLVAAVGAIGIEPGDEVITTPWTMSATAAAILHWNGIPVFADIDPDTYNLDPVSIEKNITPNTRAIVVADIFGQSADMTEIMQIAKRHKLKVISDTAQSPGAFYKERYAGTCADVGGYSLNYHKHIHTGEGGILVTDDDEIAERLQLIRNHAEVVVEDKGVENLSNMIGHNFRLGEIECAIGIEQLKKLKKIIKTRQDLAEALSEGINRLPGLKIPIIKKARTHVFYVYALQIDPLICGVDRDKLCQALRAEGLWVSPRYQNIHLLPVYQKKIAYGSKGFPWSSEICRRNVNYKKGICPIAENLQDKHYLGLAWCMFSLKKTNIKTIVYAFKKVWNQMHKIKS